MEKETLESFLRRLNIGVSIEVFEKEDIDLDFLKSLSKEELDETLKEIKLSIGNRGKILKALKSQENSMEKESSPMRSGKDAASKKNSMEKESSLLYTNVMCLKEKLMDETNSTRRSEKGVASKKENSMEKESSPMRSDKDADSKRTASCNEDEIRMVLIGKTGSGKSATGNTILGTKHFTSSVSGSSVTSVCEQKSTVRFGRKILVVDTPGIFDTKQSNTTIQQEIVKCISISSPGPHAFILVLAITRYTDEEQKAVQHFIDAFGEDIFKYFIVLFTRKDDLDEEDKSLLDHIKSVPPSLQIFIEKCGGRVTAFNNRLQDYKKEEQVQILLSMIYSNVEKNNGECYKNEIYIEAEKRLREREANIRKQAAQERENELQRMRKEISDEFAKEAEMHKTQTTQEFNKMKDEMEKKQEEKIKDAERIAQEKYENTIKKTRDIVREEIEKGKDVGLLGTVWNFTKLILPGIFSKLG